MRFISIFVGTLLLPSVLVLSQEHSILNELENHVLPQGRDPVTSVESKLHYQRGHIFDTGGVPKSPFDSRPDGTQAYLFVRVAVTPDLPIEQSDLVLFGTVKAQKAL